MNPSGDAAEQVVRLSLEGAEVTAKIAGNGAKNIALLLYATLKQEQKRIERQIVDFQDRVWGRDSVAMAKKAAEKAAADSVAAAEKKTKKTSTRRSTGRRSSDSTSSASSKKEKTPKVKQSKASSRSGSGYSVRRQRR